MSPTDPSDRTTVPAYLQWMCGICYGHVHCISVVRPFQLWNRQFPTRLPEPGGSVWTGRLGRQRELPGRQCFVPDGERGSRISSSTIQESIFASWCTSETSLESYSVTIVASRTCTLHLFIPPLLTLPLTKLPRAGLPRGVPTRSSFARLPSRDP